ncbi:MULTISPECIES: nuclear transport factor 2 family protein [unclassified Microbacterium]|uniref:nuclear transport factor 2 family protein n=1 Tax=unclassified Microbacterium TaxID=2609290 RepID=UPI00214B220C|nr:MULTISPECIES: nuclear transport factor 2 family protein [unclassified Microbacterium]MCR2783938.1 nuclear transport factor 2 family protein [Microbacterium sp. zg.B96]MDL5351271.1 nuclear transport factor 2 family protein [Microbacterium sp. zg-YB36]WIM15218.1 nuclear transport factor 2 family protein [Microbacterium sp. zg-B96]
MSRTREWLNGYITAWESKDPDDVRKIFTEDAEYFFQPDDPEAARGIDKIIEEWLDPEPTKAEHNLDVLVENDQVGIISGHVTYPGHSSYVNLWEVHFAPDGRAQKFVEWCRRDDE